MHIGTYKHDFGTHIGMHTPDFGTHMSTHAPDFGTHKHNSSPVRLGSRQQSRCPYDGSRAGSPVTPSVHVCIALVCISRVCALHLSRQNLLLSTSWHQLFWDSVAVSLVLKCVFRDQQTTFAGYDCLDLTTGIVSPFGIRFSSFVPFLSYSLFPFPFPFCHFPFPFSLFASL